jgi:hypothetical protein
MKEEISPNPPNTHEGEPNGIFDPIDQKRLEELKLTLAENTGIDFSELPVYVSNPGEFLFDLYEAQIKLYQKIGDWKACAKLLYAAGYRFNPIPADADLQMRAIAQRHGVVLDGRMPGFIYNIGGKAVVYMGIKESEVRGMAEKYALKEGEADRKFVSLEEAKEYIRSLAEKYFYHEVGHTIYVRILNPKVIKIWETQVLSNQQLVDWVIEAQKDKHPNIENIPVAN